MADDSLTARNRINQRNFRARRQNYIKDLEERLRKYESEGIQATIDIQAAARQVADQNVKLRHLLVSRYGMSEHELDSFLGPSAGNGQFIPSSLQSCLGSAPTPPPTNLAPKPYADGSPVTYATIAPQQSASHAATASSLFSPALGLASLAHVPDQPTAQHVHKKPRRTGLSEMSESPMNGSVKQRQRKGPGHGKRQSSPDTVSESSNPQTPAEQIDPLLKTIGLPSGSHSLSASQEPVPSTLHPALAITPHTVTKSGTGLHGDESCEDAARIIASMRSSDRPEDLLLQLGCAPDKADGDSRIGDTSGPGQVKDISLFQLMERA